MTVVEDNYKNFFEEYLAILQPIFEKAREESEIDFILSLLAIRSVSDAGWDPYENTEDLANETHKQQGKFKRDLRLNLNLWMYLQLIESSEQYELIANLLKTINGDHYVIANHKNKDYVNLKVEQKIDRLRKLSKNSEFKDATVPFEKTFDARLRNAIGHGDYALKKSGQKGITIIGDNDFPRLYSEQETSDLVNRALALHSVISGLKNAYIKSYRKPRLLRVNQGVLGLDDQSEVQLIVRKNHGVIGVSFVGGYDDGKPFTSSLYKCLPYEKKLIENGASLMPKSKPEQVNRVLSLLPDRLASKLAPSINRFINRGSDG